MEPTVPPWSLRGEAAVAFDMRRAPLRPVGLPLALAVIVAARYDASPVGPYLELAVAEPGRTGGHLGLRVTTMIVDSPASRDEGRRYWGFPKETAELSWESEGDERRMRWDGGGVLVSAMPYARAPEFPVMAPIRALQHRGAEAVVVPGRLRARARAARVTFEAPADDDLGPLAGGHAGLWLSRLRLTIGVAVVPDSRR